MNSEPEIKNPKPNARASRIRLVPLAALAALAIVVATLALRRDERSGEILGFLLACVGIFAAIIIMMTAYYALYLRRRLKPSREKIEKALELYKSGRRDEALKVCEALADDSSAPALARVLACANCASFNMEIGRGEEAARWREKAFKIDERRAGQFFSILEEKHETRDAPGVPPPGDESA